MYGDKISRIFIVFALLLSLIYMQRAEAEESSVASDGGIAISLEGVSRLALENNLDIQIAKYDAYIKRNDSLSAVSIFDTLLSGSVSFKDDQKKSSSVFSGNKSTAYDYKLALSKKVPSGTTFGLELQNTRSWSDSSYSSVNPAYDARFKISLEQPIGKNFFGLIDRAEIKITKLDVANSDYTSLIKIENDLADAQKSFWKLILFREQENIKTEMLKKADRLYSIYKDKHKIGLVEDPDLFASEANLNIRQNDLLIAEEKRKIAKNELLLRLNEDDLNLEIYPTEELLLDTEKMEFSKALTEAIEKNRDYQKAKNEAKARDIKLALKKNSLWPQIDIEASFLRNGISQGYKNAWEDVEGEDNPELYLGIKFSLPLENRKAKAELDQAKLEKAKYLLLLKKTEREILTEINDLTISLNSTIDRAFANQRIVKLQEKKLAAQELRFRTGRSNSDLLIRYQQDLLDARLALAHSIYECKIAAIDLKLAQDALLDEFWKEKL